MHEDDYAYDTQLQTVWPDHRLTSPPEVRTPIGYTLRTFEWGDQPHFYRLMALAGWPEWDDERLQPWLERILPQGWFMAVEQSSGRIAASAMCLHDHSTLHPFGGELGWLAGDPAHGGSGLGRLVSPSRWRVW